MDQQTKLALTTEQKKAVQALRWNERLGMNSQDKFEQLRDQLLPLMRGAAYENDAHLEAKADSVCSMGVGCGTAGVCYAEAHGRPEECMRKVPNAPGKPTAANELNEGENT